MGRLLRTESLERREVLSAAGLGGAAALQLGNALQGTAGDCDAVQVGTQDGEQLQQHDRSGHAPTHREAFQHSQQQGDDQQRQQQNGNQDVGTPISNSLDAQETADLLHMREEEKLARDVYQALGDEYGASIFANIAASEQQHMDAVGNLIAKYGLTDPVGDNPAGVFENEGLQELYDALIDRGMTSLTAAYQVGVDIEVLDIDDLEVAIADTDNADIEQVYRSLLSGSENHLVAFTAALEGVDVTGTGTNSGSGAQNGQGQNDGQNGSQNGQQLMDQQQDQLQLDQQQDDQQLRQRQVEKERDIAFAEIGSQAGEQVQGRAQNQTSTVADGLIQKRIRTAK